MRELPRIPIIEEYIQYQTSRGCYAKRTLNGWRLRLGLAYRKNCGECALISTPVDSLNLGKVSSQALTERRRMVLEFREWYRIRNQICGLQEAIAASFEVRQ